jgi:Helix-turn-helix domain
MSQRSLILDALREAGERGCCLNDFAAVDLFLPYRSRNVISELRRDGVPIRSAVCKTHRHRSSVARYYLAPFGQLALIP